ncbi:Hypothetical protein GLP15_4063 [Giardia lamblia P15]|uniref:Uncharacterized protein n=1 Tax=Giardia intestinalis (strain P15) TaxID=658858 RepID=E1F3C1_GIAIA|nr:Hypothetical protein GLP15_4063 [Giardia lamblia P15]
MNIDAFIFSLVMYRARSVIGTHDTRQLHHVRYTNCGCTNTPLQTTRSPTKGRLSSIREGPSQVCVNAPQVPSTITPRVQSPAFGHLNAVRKSLRDIGAQHSSCTIYHESPAKDKELNQRTEIQRSLSVSDLISPNQQTMVFDHEKIEPIVHKLLDDRDRRIEEIKDKLFEDVKKEMDCRHELIDNIVHLISIEQKRTQRLLSRSAIANKLIRKVQVDINEQLTQIAELRTRIENLELRLEQEKTQKPQLQSAIDQVKKFEDTIATSTSKINQQIKTVHHYLQELQCSLERFILEQRKLRANGVDSGSTVNTAVSSIHQQLATIFPLRSLLTDTSKE